MGEGLPSYLTSLKEKNGQLIFRETFFKFWAALITLGTFGNGGFIGPVGRVSAGVMSSIGKLFYNRFRFECRIYRSRNADRFAYWIDIYFYCRNQPGHTGIFCFSGSRVCRNAFKYHEHSCCYSSYHIRAFWLCIQFTSRNGFDYRFSG